jgi:hypothetical protein
MPVTRKHVPKLSTAASLRQLALFLNFDFAGPKVTAARQEWESLRHPLFQLLYRPKQQLKIEQVQRLQQELRQDLLATVAPEPWQVGDLDAHLERLLEKINSLGLVSVWDIEPFDRRWLRRYGAVRWRANSDALKLKPIRSVERIVSVGGFRWLLKKQLPATSIRERLYRIIIDALEGQELSKLKRCEKCQKFFVAEDPREKLCSPQCKRLYDREGAKRRMQRLRQRRRSAEAESLRTEGLPKLIKLADLIRKKGKHTVADLLAEIPELQSLRHHLGEKWESFKPLLERLIQPRTRPKSLWSKMPKQLRKKFASGLV